MPALLFTMCQTIQTALLTLQKPGSRKHNKTSFAGQQGNMYHTGIRIKVSIKISRQIQTIKIVLAHFTTFLMSASWNMGDVMHSGKWERFCFLECGECYASWNVGDETRFGFI